MGKAPGIYGIPLEVVQSPTAVYYMCTLHKLFDRCFSSGLTPDIWQQGIINPIPKSGNNDNRVPMNCRGITLAPSIAKLYTSVLNARLVRWTEANGIIVDEQNSFRGDRSCPEHIQMLTNIIETRKKKRKDTFVGFVDFQKAYDRIDRSLLWHKLATYGIRDMHGRHFE